MICVVDVETQGLNCQKFQLGCLYISKRKQEYFYKKEDLWARVIELGKLEMKKKRVLTIYSHNANYDAMSYFDLNDRNIRYYSLKPFIAEYRINGVTAIKFLDSLGIFKMSLKDVGEYVGLSKLETPNEFIEGLEREKKQLTEKDLEYCKRDCQIVYLAIDKMKNKLKEEGVNLRRIYTISQIAVNYFMNKLRETKKYDCLFEDNRRISFIKSKQRGHIHKAYRGGRVECFKTGEFKQVSYIDCNSMYGKASMEIAFPDIRTEKFEYNPLRYNKVENVINGIGIVKCMIKNVSNKLGLLPIRTLDGSYYPKEGKLLIGVWTIDEIKLAINEGYELIDIEWIITYDEMINPFKEITNRLYNLRLSSTNEFDKLFYKSMMNHSFGKLAQKKPRWELVIDSVELVDKYKKLCYNIIKGIGDNDYMYEKEIRERDKNYYLPIVPTLINAWARIYMYNQMKKFDLNNLIYHDTDSIIFTGDVPKDIIIGQGIGEFKLVESNRLGIFYGRKNYMVGEEARISGFRKQGITMDEFRVGKVTNLRMETIKTTKDFNKVGLFKKENRDLKEDGLRFNEIMSKLKEQEVFVDSDTTNINWFLNKLDGYTL